MRVMRRFPLAWQKQGAKQNCRRIVTFSSKNVPEEPSIIPQIRPILHGQEKFCGLRCFPRRRSLFQLGFVLRSIRVSNFELQQKLAFGRPLSSKIFSSCQLHALVCGGTFGSKNTKPQKSCLDNSGRVEPGPCLRRPEPSLHFEVRPLHSTKACPPVLGVAEQSLP